MAAITALLEDVRGEQQRPLCGTTCSPNAQRDRRRVRDTTTPEAP